MSTASRAACMVAVLAALAFGACHPHSATPPDIADLERQVSLQLAHVRDKGPTAPEERRKMSEAAQLEAAAERAIAAGDWRTAEDQLLQARDLLGPVNQ